jgi:uncharacterized coiled-coil DUF342 family protein
LDSDIIIRQFEAIEKKVERVLDVCRSLEAANSELENKIKALEGELQGKVAAENSYIEERDLIKSRIDKLLAKLDHVSES